MALQSDPSLDDLVLGTNVTVRIPSIALFTRALLFALVLALAGNAKSYAQDADVKAVIDAYHGALNSLDAAKMESLWAHDASVTLVNPSDKSIAVGWDAVKKGWDGLFNALVELKVAQVDGPHISVKGDVAWATGIASVRSEPSRYAAARNLRPSRRRIGI